MSDTLIRLQEISKSYPADRERLVLDHLDLSISPGDRLAIVGPSGSGKSTLLNILGTLDTPSSGQVWFQGESVDGKTPDELAALRSEQIGFIFQLHHLLPQCTVMENVLIPTLACANKDEGVNERASKLLDRIGLSGHENKFPAQLSGGERQRVAVVRSLINRPGLLLADEPTGALDEANAENLINLLLEISEAEEVALVLVTHDRQLAARMEATQELREGKLHLLNS